MVTPKRLQFEHTMLFASFESSDVWKFEFKGVVTDFMVPCPVMNENINRGTNSKPT